MPRIPTTDPQVGLNIGNQPNMPLSFGTAPGRAVQKLGSAISGLQGTFNAAAKAQEKDDLFKTKLALGEFAGDQDRFQAEYDNGVSEDGSNHANKRLETYDKAAGKLYERIPQSEASRKYAALQLQRMRNRYGNQSTDVEIRQRGRYTINQTTGFIKNQVLPKITGEVKSALTGLDLINGLVESSPIRDDVKEKIRDGAVKTVLEAWVAKAGPEAAARAETLAAAYGPGAREGATPGSPRAAQEDNPNRGTENVSRETQANSAPRIVLGDDQRKALRGVNDSVIERFGQLQGALGTTFKINSGYRDPAHNQRVGGARSSQHIARNAIDIDVRNLSPGERLKVIEEASRLGFKGIGVYDNAIHIDMGNKRSWGPTYRRQSVPKWAEPTIRAHEAGEFASNRGEGRRSSPTVFTSGKAKRQPHGWARTDQRWKSLNQFEKAALMSLMEAGGGKNSVNALGAMINRAAKEGEDLGAHVSGKIYQPTWEASQRARMDRLLNSPEFPQLVEWAKRRIAGEEPDPVNGATHFLVHEKTMLALEARNPRKYRSWRKWTKFDPKTGQYGNVMLRDETHAFNAPDGKFSYSPNGEGKIEIANDNPPDLKERFARELIKQLPQIQRASERAEQQEQIEERRERRKIEAETRFEGTKLLFAGELTEQWLEENEGNLSISQRERFLKALNPIIRATNPQIAAELSDRAGSGEDPAAVIDDIESAYVAGDLTRADANRLAAKAYGGESKANAPPWQKRLASDLRVRLKPPKDGSPEEWQDYYEAQQEFDEYVAKSGENLDRKSLTEFTQDLVKEKLGERVKANREGLSMMRFSQVGRGAMTLDEVNAAEIRMLQALQARKISQAEANAEWKLIKSWRKTLEDEYKALGKEPPKPQGPIRPQAADRAPAATPATPDKPGAVPFGFAPGANLQVDPAVAAEVKAYSETLPDEVKMQLLDEAGNPKPETMQLVSSAMALGATPDKVPSILQTIYGMGGDDVPFYQQDGVNVSTTDFNQAYQKEADWRSSPWGAIDSWAERMIGQYDQAAASDESDMTRRQLLEMLGVEILSDDDYADVQRRWKESQEWIKQNVPTSVARGLLQFGNSLLSVRGNDIADLDQAVPLDPVIMGLEGLRSATRWLSMNPNRIRPQDMLAAPGMAFMAAPFIRAARSAPGSAAQAMMRGVTDEDPTVAMPAMRNVTPDNDVAGRGIPQATPVENATGAISRDVPPPAAANDMAQSRPPIVTERPEMQHWGAHVDVVNRKYLAEEGASVEVSKAYTSYRREAVRAGIEPLDQSGFSRMMADAGFEKAQIGGRPRYVGIVMAEQSKGQTAGTAITSAAERATTQNVRSVEDLIKEFKIKKVDESQSPAPPVPREIDDVGYTSQALEAARRLKQEKGTPEQLLSQLKKAGVKDAEIESTGLREFMDGKKSVTRAELVKHLRENRVDVRQRVRRGEGPPQERYVETDLPGNYPVRREMGEAAPQPRPDIAKWQEYSVDEYNPTYRETVVHLPQRAKGDDFHQGHFPEPNVVGHLRSSVHDGPNGKQYVVNELQSDWGQKLRKDGGARDEAKINALSTAHQAAEREVSRVEGEIGDILYEYVKRTDQYEQPATIEKRLSAGDGDADLVRRYRAASNQRESAQAEVRLRRAELYSAEAATPGNPLVNTTDQWVTTMLRKSLMEAVDSDAKYITIASGRTVHGYDMGTEESIKVARVPISSEKARELRAKGIAPDSPEVFQAAGIMAIAKREGFSKDDVLHFLKQSQGAKEMDGRAGRVYDTVIDGSDLPPPRDAEAAKEIYSLIQSSADDLPTVKVTVDGVRKAYDEMYPKKLRDILKKIDPEAAKSMERIATVKASDGEDVGEGFVRFKLTDKVREEVRRGLPLFSKSDSTAANAIKSAEDRKKKGRD
jgi:uncharacterized protein YcbK (DUF882 family)